MIINGIFGAYGFAVPNRTKITRNVCNPLRFLIDEEYTQFCFFSLPVFEILNENIIYAKIV